MTALAMNLKTLTLHVSRPEGLAARVLLCTEPGQVDRDWVPLAWLSTAPVTAVATALNYAHLEGKRTCEVCRATVSVMALGTVQHNPNTPDCSDECGGYTPAGYLCRCDCHRSTS